MPDETAARARDCETIVVEADFWRHARLSWLAYACIVYTHILYTTAPGLSTKKSKFLHADIGNYYHTKLLNSIIPLLEEKSIANPIDL